MLGESVVAEFIVKRVDLLHDQMYLKDVGISAARDAKATIYGEPLCYQDDHGETHVIIPLGESHIAIHTRSDLGILMLDIFTCGNIRAGDALKTIYRYFPPCRDWEIWYSRGRGIVEP